MFCSKIYGWLLKLRKKVREKISRMKGAVEKRLKKLANAIYDEGIGAFGEVSAKGKKNKSDKQGEIRRETKINKLR